MIVAAVIIISLAYVFRYPISLPSNDGDLIKQQGISVLNHLSSQDLRFLTYNDIDALNERIDLLLSDAIESVACLDCLDVEIPSDKSVVVLTHYFAGEDSYEPVSLKIYLWRRSL